VETFNLLVTQVVLPLNCELAWTILINIGQYQSIRINFQFNCRALFHMHTTLEGLFRISTRSTRKQSKLIRMIDSVPTCGNWDVHKAGFITEINPFKLPLDCFIFGMLQTFHFFKQCISSFHVIASQLHAVGQRADKLRLRHVWKTWQLEIGITPSFFKVNGNIISDRFC